MTDSLESTTRAIVENIYIRATIAASLGVLSRLTPNEAKAIVATHEHDIGADVELLKQIGAQYKMLGQVIELDPLQDEQHRVAFDTSDQ